VKLIDDAHQRPG